MPASPAATFTFRPPPDRESTPARAAPVSGEVLLARATDHMGQWPMMLWNGHPHIGR